MDMTDFATWIIEHRRALHVHPELGFSEHWTAAYLADIFCGLGLEVTQGIARTGLVAVLPGEDRNRPALGYRADMDALPIVEKTEVPFRSTNGCMHACGHDAHMAVALGIARKLVSRPRRLLRDVVFVLQPNEEGAPGADPSGAELMCQEGILERFRIGQMLALHSDPTLPTGIMGVRFGCLWAASGRFRVRVKGVGAHAAYPEKGRDALLAAAQMIPAIYAAKSRCRAFAPEVLSICQLEAGTAFNVVADRAVFDGILRTPSRQAMDELADMVEQTCRGIAQACGVTVECERFYGANAVYNDTAMAQIALETWQKRGVGREVGMNLASEDFSYFSERVASFFAMMGIRPREMAQIPPSHASDFFLDESSLEMAVDAMIDLIDALDG